jgi:hypothetical protein
MQSIYVFCVILTIRNDYFYKQDYLVAKGNGDAARLVWGGN